MRFWMPVKCVLSFLFYRLLLLGLPAGKANCDDKRVAIVCAASLGDFVVSCSAARELFRQGKQLTLVCREGTGIEEFAALTGYFAEIKPLRNSLWDRTKNRGELRKLCAHTVLVMPPERHILSDIYALSIRADRRIFPDTTQGCSLPSLKRIVDGYADRLVPVSAVREQTRYEEYLKGAGLYDGSIRPFVFEDRRSTRERPPREYIMVFPGAGGGQFKQWPVERFAYVAGQLHRERGCRVLVCGTAEERPLGQKLCDLLVEGGENLCGETSIAELGELFRGATLVLANDSGSAHLSVAFGAPTVIICGGWEYGRFYPNEDLSENCVAITRGKESFPCIPCGDSRTSCMANNTTMCILAISQNEVIKTAQYYISQITNEGG